MTVDVHLDGSTVEEITDKMMKVARKQLITCFKEPLNIKPEYEDYVDKQVHSYLETLRNSFFQKSNWSVRFEFNEQMKADTYVTSEE